MLEIPIGHDLITLVDDEDAERMKYNYWRAVNFKGRWYVKAYESSSPTGYLLLHRFLTNAPEGLEVDHIDRNSLNNQKSNLRIVTHQKNLCNQKVNSRNTLGYRGLQITPLGRWAAKTRTHGKPMYFGTFDTILDAALAYDKGMRELHGLDVHCNFPIDAEETINWVDPRK